MFSVVISNVHGTCTHVEQFETRKQALDFIASLSEDLYMVSLRNDDQTLSKIVIPL